VIAVFRAALGAFRLAEGRAHRTSCGARGRQRYLAAPSNLGGFVRMLEARDRAVAPTGSLSIDSRRSRLTFDVHYFGILRVQGEFRDMRGEIFGMDPRALSAASVTAVVPIASLATGIRLRDWHLSSRGYLAARRWPEATFQSERIVPDGRAGARVIGVLTLRGVAREVVLHVNECRFDGGERRMHARGHLTIHRSDFTVGPPRRAPWWDVRRYLIDDEVRVVLHVEAVEHDEEP
jgi:polyisoprenoid-binding protein YceI